MLQVTSTILCTLFFTVFMINILAVLPHRQRSIMVYNLSSWIKWQLSNPRYIQNSVCIYFLCVCMCIQHLRMHTCRQIHTCTQSDICMSTLELFTVTSAQLRQQMLTEFLIIIRLQVITSHSGGGWLWQSKVVIASTKLNFSNVKEACTQWNGPYPKLCEAIQAPYTTRFTNAILSLYFHVASVIFWLGV